MDSLSWIKSGQALLASKMYTYIVSSRKVEKLTNSSGHEVVLKAWRDLSWTGDNGQGNTSTKHKLPALQKHIGKYDIYKSEQIIWVKDITISMGSLLKHQSKNLTQKQRSNLVIIAK